MPRPDENAPCPSCGEPVAPSARFCPGCGTRLEAGSTVAVPLPPQPPGPAPVSVEAVEPRFFGVTPLSALLALGVAAAAVGVVLLVLDSTLAGGVVLAAGVLALGLFAASMRWPAAAAGEVRSRALYLGAAASARTAARREVARLRQELDKIAAERRAALVALGEAVYAGDDAARERIRGRVDELDAATDEKERAIEAVLEDVERRVGRARLETSRTEIVSVQEPYPPPNEADPPEPARIPEPSPPPGEADPPEPARIPEPYPPPDEGDLPEPPPAAEQPPRG